MTRVRQLWDDFMGVSLGEGVHKYDGRGDFSGHRYHLRVDSSSRGVLMIDASRIVFLNGTALDYVRLCLEGRSKRQVYRYIYRRYKDIDKGKVAKDYEGVRSRLLAIIKGDLSVVQYLGPKTFSAGSDNLPAPYRMDLALTYRCQNDCGHCYNEVREKSEIAPEQWKEVIEKLWKLGVPHVVFTGGEPTLYPRLADLIEKSEEMGQITGLVTNGRSLGEPGYLKNLVEKGLDHVQITVLSHLEAVHDRFAGQKGAWAETVKGLKVALAEDLYVSTNTTMMRDNIETIEDTMRFLMSLGVKNISFNSIIRSGKGEKAEGVSCKELAPILMRLNALAEEAKVKMTWYSPTPYCELNPVTMGLGIKQCTACSINMAIEPDGTVIPCQSYYEPMGNMLTDSWDSIWNHRLCKEIRERKYLDEKCLACGLVQLCGGGCPLSIKHGDYLCDDSHSSA
jgi:radical SAM protein with 4Fe4S-binding SPASM domain